MKQRNISLTQIFGIEGWKISRSWFENEAKVRLLRKHSCPRHLLCLVVVLERECAPRCSRCGRARQKIYEHTKTRRWRDQPVGGLRTWIEATPVRVECTHCSGALVEALPFADPLARKTRRFEHQLTVESSAASVAHTASMHGLSWGSVQRAEHASLLRWEASRTEPLLRLVGIDEKYLGRRGKWPERFVTIVSNLATGEPVWWGFGRREETVKRWLSTLTDKQKADIVVVAMDMHDPFRLAIEKDPKLAHVKVAHDPFHVTKRANQAIEELRRQVFFRAGKERRAVGRGARWLFLKAEEKLSPKQKEHLGGLLRYNKVLARAYQVKEELRHVLRSTTREDMDAGLKHILRRIQLKRHTPLRALHDSLRKHRGPILALAEHRPPTGRIEALNNNWETLVRRGRGYRNLQYLFLKLRFSIAYPIRSHGAIGRFLALAETALDAAA